MSDQLDHDGDAKRITADGEILADTITTASTILQSEVIQVRESGAHLEKGRERHCKIAERAMPSDLTQA
jgi:hypothetical protein